MYHFSRSIYRELAPRVIGDEEDPTGNRNRQVVLDACEAAIQRMTYDGRYFANPARWLFGEVRPYVGMTDQVYVWRVVEMNINLALKFLASRPGGVDIDGRPRHCQAHTRDGTPCQRVPLPGRDFCPSHKHFEEFLADTGVPASA